MPSPAVNHIQEITLQIHIFIINARPDESGLQPPSRLPNLNPNPSTINPNPQLLNHRPQPPDSGSAPAGFHSGLCDPPPVQRTLNPSTRWSTALSSKVNLHHAIKLMALRSENLVTYPADSRGNETFELHRVEPKTSSSEEGSYLRLVDLLYHSTLGRE
jgi:hypothetical protein